MIQKTAFVENLAKTKDFIKQKLNKLEEHFPPKSLDPQKNKIERNPKPINVTCIA